MPMIPAILGFMPALDLRRNSAIKSGRAAKVVPKPATRPTISERLNSGKSRLPCIPWNQVMSLVWTQAVTEAGAACAEEEKLLWLVAGCPVHLLSRSVRLLSTGEWARASADYS